MLKYNQLTRQNVHEGGGTLEKNYLEAVLKKRTKCARTKTYEYRLAFGL